MGRSRFEGKRSTTRAVGDEKRIVRLIKVGSDSADSVFAFFHTIALYLDQGWIVWFGGVCRLFVAWMLFLADSPHLNFG